METFTHERLDVYRAAIEHLVLADRVAGELPKGRAYIADQLRRAALSIANNIAEGAGEFAAADKARFYRMARRSGTECASILYACRSLALADVEHLDAARAILDRVVAMLTGLVKRHRTSDGDADGDADARRARRCDQS